HLSTSNSQEIPLVTKKHPRYSAPHTFFPNILCPSGQLPVRRAARSPAPAGCRASAEKVTRSPASCSGQVGKTGLPPARMEATTAVHDIAAKVTRRRGSEPRNTRQQYH